VIFTWFTHDQLARSVVTCLCLCLSSLAYMSVSVSVCVSVCLSLSVCLSTLVISPVDLLPAVWYFTV